MTNILITIPGPLMAYIYINGKAPSIKTLLETYICRCLFLQLIKTDKIHKNKVSNGKKDTSM